MHTVVETAPYLSSAKAEGMTADELKLAVDMIAADPEAGDLIVGAGGCRKVRIPGKGRGKSGGYRVVTYYFSDSAPVFLLAVLAKGSRANFSGAECATLAKAAKRLRDVSGK
ncbi:MAG: type II toxin-antitoxin system RelE/ParE family toxin [Parvularculaceae bacterium]|nr:type II toxin-antitoxin system RelE/ParE family toxin [Parvularculaceae bacterium]